MPVFNVTKWPILQDDPGCRVAKLDFVNMVISGDRVSSENHKNHTKAT